MFNFNTKKQCTKCGKWKSLSDFGKHKTRKDGLQAWCKTCKRASDKNYRETHHDTFIESIRRWWSENSESYNARRRQEAHDNPEKFREQKRNWRANNRDRAIELDRKWKENNLDKWRESYRKAAKKMLAEHPEKVAEYRARWRAKYPEKEAALQENRRARISNSGTITADEWRGVLEKYNYRCIVPGCTREDVTMDHVKSLAKGGIHTVDNVQPLCGYHNSSKGTKEIDYR